MCIKTIVFITDYELSNESGATYARMICYAKALSLKGISVILTSALNIFQSNEDFEIIEGNIHLLGNNRESKASSKKVLPLFSEIKFYSIYLYLKKLQNRFHNYKNLTYLLFPTNLALSFTAVLYLKVIKMNRVFIEKNELHLGIALNMSSPAGIKRIVYVPSLFMQVIIGVLTDFIEIFFDGMICISTRMESVYSRFNKNTIRIPILAECPISYPNIDDKKSSEIFRIGYAGTISEKKDGILTMINCLKVLRNTHKNIEFNLYGSGTSTILKKMHQLIQNNHISDIVKYHGNLTRTDIQEILITLDLLVLTRPSNLQTNYGFSTKLAEYMLSGVPVLSTRVSDVPIYIFDKVNGLLLEKNSMPQLLNKLSEIIINRNQLSRIGKEGKATALKYFCYQSYSEILYNFLFKLE